MQYLCFAKWRCENDADDEASQTDDDYLKTYSAVQYQADTRLILNHGLGLFVRAKMLTSKWFHNQQLSGHSLHIVPHHQVAVFIFAINKVPVAVVHAQMHKIVNYTISL